MKKIFLGLLGLMIGLLLVSTSFAHSLWDVHWAPGEYIPEMNENLVVELFELKDEVLQMSEGTPASRFIDTYEHQYEMQKSLGSSAEVYEQYYDDIGKYALYFGLPNDQVITQDQAWLIAYQALIEQGVVCKDELLHYLPQCLYVVYDPDHPAWYFDFMSWDEPTRPVIAVGVYAEDGSIFGIKHLQSVG